MRGFLEIVTRLFGLWVVVVAGVALVAPSLFTWALPWLKILLGIIMFGMGMTLTPQDFKRVLKRPLDAVIGVAAQYGIMPLVGFGIAWALGLPPELAVGVVLVGACPGGTASNVIVYLARGDVALSVLLTSVSTLFAPLLTPVLTLWLADRWMAVPAESLFLSILQIVILPIILGMGLRRFAPQAVAKAGPVMPLVSVAIIALVVGAIIGKEREMLLSSGGGVALAVILHNLCGLALGYGLATLLKRDQAGRRTVAVEVGMQNSGLAVALATAHLSPLAAVPGALFSVWHNVSGAVLAGIWGKGRADSEPRAKA